MLDLWYKDAVIYSLDVETFQDGNSRTSGDKPYEVIDGNREISLEPYGFRWFRIGRI